MRIQGAPINQELILDFGLLGQSLSIYNLIIIETASVDPARNQVASEIHVGPYIKVLCVHKLNLLPLSYIESLCDVFSFTFTFFDRSRTRALRPRRFPFLLLRPARIRYPTTRSASKMSIMSRLAPPFTQPNSLSMERLF